GLGANLLPQPRVAPVLAHAGVHEVLVDGRQLGGEDVVQRGDDPILTSHVRAPLPRAGAAPSMRSASAGAQAPQSPLAPQTASTAAAVRAPAATNRRLSPSETP